MFERSIQKNRGHSGGQQQRSVIFLRKSTAAQSHDSRPSAAQLFQYLLQSRPLRPAKGWLAGIPKNLSHRTPFAPFDAVVEIFELTVQLFSQGAANAGFSRAHESDQKHGAV